MNRKSILGTYLIESAILLLVGIPIFLSAIDITSINRAETALETALEEAIRCVYPLNGKCRRNGPAQQGYDWFKYERRMNFRTQNAIYDLNQSDAEYLIKKDYFTWNNYKARVTEAINFKVPTKEYVLDALQKDIEQQIQYQEQISYIPHLKDQSARDSELTREEPTFQTSRKIEINKVKKTSSIEIGIQHIIAESGVTSGLKCYKNIGAQASLGEIFGDQPPCDPGLEEGILPIAFLIGAEAFDGTKGESTSVELSLEISNERGSKTIIHLGGQTFSAPGKGKKIITNFHPRGFLAENLSRNLIDEIKFDGELPTWATKQIKLPKGTTALRLMIEHGSKGEWSNELHFDITSIRVFSPKFQSRNAVANCKILPTNSSEQCQLKILNTAIGAPSGIPLYPSYSKLSPPGFIKIGGEKTFKSIFKDHVIGDFEGELEAQSKAKEIITNLGYRTNSVELRTTASNRTKTRSKKYICSKDPFHGGFRPDSNDCINNLQKEFPNSLELTKEERIIRVPQNTKEQDLYNWDSIWEPATCSEQHNFTPPVGLLRYQSYEQPLIAEAVVNSRIISENISHFIESNEKSKAITLKEPYRCEHFRLINSETQLNSLESSATTKRVILPYYSSEHDCTKKREDELIKHFGTTTKEWDGRYSVIVTGENLSTSPPEDSCIPYSISYLSPKKILIARDLPKELTPEECQGVTNCIRILHSDKKTGDETLLSDLKLAEQIATDAILAQFAHLKTACKHKDYQQCYNVQASIADNKVSLDGEISVPSFILKNRVIKKKLSRILETQS